MEVSNASVEADQIAPTYILYDRHQRSLDNISKHFPTFYEHISDTIKSYQVLLSLPLNHETNHYIVSIFCKYWQNLVPSLQEKWKQVRICIISDLNVGHAQLVEDTLHYSFGPRITCKIYDELTISEEIFRQLKPDIILSNFPLPEYDFAATVCIDDMLDISTIKEITELINLINVEKQKVITY